MKYLPNLLIVLGVCLSALGASGFHTPFTAVGDAPATREPYALALFLFGCLALGVGGFLGRQLRQGKTEGASSGHSVKEVFVGEIEAIRALIAQLDDDRERLEPRVIHQRIDELMAQQYFDLTSKSDELAALLGFGTYAKVWEGVATAERLLNRSWSMITDGHPEEGLAELPLARRSIEQAAAAMAEA